MLEIAKSGAKVQKKKPALPTSSRNPDRDREFYELQKSGVPYGKIMTDWNNQHKDEQVAESAIRKTVSRWKQRIGEK